MDLQDEVNQEKSYKTLIKWACVVLNNISDQSLPNEIIVQLLRHIDQQYFGSKVSFQNQIHDNYFIKAILKDVINYCHEILCLHFNAQCIPDFNEGSIKLPELAKLFQLILGCAVNCENKQVYIEKILEMEQESQEVIMNLIQELDLKEEEQPAVVAIPSPTFKDYQISRLESELERALVEKERFQMKYEDMAEKLALLEEEKANLSMDNQRLYRINSKDPEVSNEAKISEIDGERKMAQELKREINALKEEIYKLELAKDDANGQWEVVKVDNVQLKKKINEMLDLVSEAQKFKDEVDVLRHMAEKIPRYEANIESLQKRIDTLSFESRLNVLHEDKGEILKNSTEREEDKKKLNMMKIELETLKSSNRQLVESNENDRERLEKCLVEKVELKEKIAKIESENQNLVVENKRLLDENHHLNLCLLKDEVKDVEMVKSSKSDFLLGSEGMDGKSAETKEPNDGPESQSAQLEKFKNEKAEMEARYMKYFEKAKMIITQLTSGTENATQLHNGHLFNDQLEEKDALIQDLKNQVQQLRTSQEIIAMAWNNLALRMYKQNMNEGLSTSLWSANSFLNRQRIISSKYKKI